MGELYLIERIVLRSDGRLGEKTRMSVYESKGEADTAIVALLTKLVVKRYAVIKHGVDLWRVLDTKNNLAEFRVVPYHGKAA